MSDTSNTSFPWKLLFLILKPFLLSKHSPKALGLIAGVVFCIVAKTWLTVYINAENGNVWGALHHREVFQFWKHLGYYAALVALVMPLDVLRYVCVTVVVITLRAFTSSTLFGGYLAGYAALMLEWFNQGKADADKIDNPEWRMTAEVDALSNTLFGVLFPFFEAGLIVITMGTVLWQMSPYLSLTNAGYALAGSVVIFFLGRPLSKFNEKQQLLEGNLRAGLTLARNQIGLVTSYRGEGVELGLSNQRQDLIVENLMGQMLVNRNMQMFQILFNQLAPLIPLGIMGAIYLGDSNADFEVIGKAQANFGTMFAGMSVFVAQYGGISYLRALTNRIGALLEFLQAAGVKPLPEGKFIHIEPGEAIECNAINVTMPDGAPLVKDLDLKLQPGESLLVRGAKATTKSALLGSIIGIWPHGNGTVKRVDRSLVMILSADPYMRPMSLRQALSYPASDLTDVSDVRIKEVLGLVDLGELVQGDVDMDKVQNWPELLSPSKQQRLAIARVILKKPKFCLIDEAAKAMEAENEKLLIGLLKLLGVGYMIAGNNEGLVQHAGRILEIADDGSWRIQESHGYETTFWRGLASLVPSWAQGQ